MGRDYNHLSIEERTVLAAGLEQGLSRRAIARLLNRSSSTIIREIKRNKAGSTYRPQVAHNSGQRRRTHPARKLVTNPELWQEVLRMLERGWSPQQVAGILKKMHPDDPEKRVSHETIYAHIYAHPRGDLRQALIDKLRKKRKKRMPRSRGTDRRGQLVDITPFPSVQKRLKAVLFRGIGRGI